MLVEEEHGSEKASAEERRTIRGMLVSRGITRSGDHAWDLALPLTIAGLFPGSLTFVSIYFLSGRLLNALLLPRLGRWLDHNPRDQTLKTALLLQATGILLVAVLMSALMRMGPVARYTAGGPVLVLIGLMTVAGCIASIGYALMNISIALDWIPQLFRHELLPKVNSKLSRTDLSMEILSPLATGFLLAITNSEHFLFSGFFWVLCWNLFSFIPEGIILFKIYTTHPALQQRQGSEIAATSTSLSIVEGAKLLFQQPIWPVVVTYSLLWITVLSPHNVLLTAFLKTKWHIDEFSIGIFRGLGAAIGIAASYVFTNVAKRGGVPLATALFVSLQGVSLTICCFGFHSSSDSFYFVAICILVSRLGLYGFALGDTQLRQMTIPDGIRGTVNGFASSLNNTAGLVLYIVSLFVQDTDVFVLLAWLSAFAVSGGALLTLRWYGKYISPDR